MPHRTEREINKIGRYLARANRKIKGGAQIHLVQDDDGEWMFRDDGMHSEDIARNWKRQIDSWVSDLNQSIGHYEAVEEKFQRRIMEAQALFEDVMSTILRQMGGSGRLKAMIGARKFSSLKDVAKAYAPKTGGNQGLWFMFKNPRRSKGNAIAIEYNAGRDTYNVEFINVKKFGGKTVKYYENVYAEDLKDIFERQTGMYLSL